MHLFIKSCKYYIEWKYHYGDGSQSQPAFTCLKSTIEPSEQCVKSVQLNNKNTSLTSLRRLYC